VECLGSCVVIVGSLRSFDSPVVSGDVDSSRISWGEPSVEDVRHGCGYAFGNLSFVVVGVGNQFAISSANSV